MARKQLIALATLVALAAAGTAAHAAAFRIVDEAFVSTKTRAEVHAEVLKARAEATLGIGEIDLSPTMAAKRDSLVTRAQVRAEVGDAARKAIMQWYPV